MAADPTLATKQIKPHFQPALCNAMPGVEPVEADGERLASGIRNSQRLARQVAAAQAELLGQPAAAAGGCRVGLLPREGGAGAARARGARVPQGQLAAHHQGALEQDCVKQECVALLQADDGGGFIDRNLGLVWCFECLLMEAACESGDRMT